MQIHEFIASRNYACAKNYLFAKNEAGCAACRRKSRFIVGLIDSRAIELESSKYLKLVGLDLSPTTGGRPSKTDGLGCQRNSVLQMMKPFFVFGLFLSLFAFIALPSALKAVKSRVICIVYPHIKLSEQLNSSHQPSTRDTREGELGMLSQRLKELKDKIRLVSLDQLVKFTLTSELELVETINISENLFNFNLIPNLYLPPF